MCPNYRHADELKTQGFIGVERTLYFSYALVLWGPVDRVKCRVRTEARHHVLPISSTLPGSSIFIGHPLACIKGRHGIIAVMMLMMELDCGYTRHHCSVASGIIKRFPLTNGYMDTINDPFIPPRSWHARYIRVADKYSERKKTWRHLAIYRLVSVALTARRESL